MKNPSPLHLVLFFTEGVSLKSWDRVGMFDREVALYQRLQDKGVQVSLVTYGNGSELEYRNRVPGMRILCNRWSLSAPIYRLLLPLLHGVRLWRADVIKTNQTRGADLALRAARFWRKPLVARCGYMWSQFAARKTGMHSPETTKAREIEQRVFDAAQGVVVTTHEMQKDVSSRIPAAASRVIVIPNYVETNRFRPKDELREENSILFVGRISPQKNLSALLDAVRPLNVRLTIIGRGELEEELRRSSCIPEDRIRWLGNVPNSELPNHMNRCSMFILPSHYEGHPKALIEAMACGLPVIGADSPGIRTLIRHGKTGYLCGTDAGSIQKAIEELLADPALCRRMGMNACQYAAKHFSLDRIVDLELDLLREVVNR